MKKFTSRFGRRSAAVTVRVDDEGVVIERAGRKEPLVFQWRDVDEIRTFKVGLVTTDDIRLAFWASGLWYEISEEDAGFTALAELMRAKFPSIPEDWYWTVMKPAFATNQRTLWKRGEERGHS
jgi:hypothetical protein